MCEYGRSPLVCLTKLNTRTWAYSAHAGASQSRPRKGHYTRDQAQRAATVGIPSPSAAATEHVITRPCSPSTPSLHTCALAEGAEPVTAIWQQRVRSWAAAAWACRPAQACSDALVRSVLPRRQAMRGPPHQVPKRAACRRRRGRKHVSFQPTRTARKDLHHVTTSSASATCATVATTLQQATPHRSDVVVHRSLH